MRRVIKCLVVLISIPALIFAGWWCHEHYVFDELFGPHGDSVGYIKIISGGKTNKIRVGGDTIRMFGRSIDAAKIVTLLEKRADSIKPGPEIWRNHRYTRSETKIRDGAEILLKIKHPKALGIFVRLLDDPLYVYDAPEWLVKLDDMNACPYLLKSWRKRREYTFVYIAAFRKLPYAPAVPDIINSFEIQMPPDEMEYYFQTLETITGDDLRRFRRGVMVYPQDVQQLKLQLNNWWKHSSANIEKNQTAGQRR